MDDLIWVGNTLIPRSVVFGVAALIALALIGLWTWLTPNN